MRLAIPETRFTHPAFLMAGLGHGRVYRGWRRWAPTFAVLLPRREQGVVMIQLSMARYTTGGFVFGYINGRYFGVER